MNDSYEQQIRDYLACCRQAKAELQARGSALDPKYHPAADGAVKMIPHLGDPAEAKKIRQAFRELTGDAPPVQAVPGRQAA